MQYNLHISFWEKAFFGWFRGSIESHEEYNMLRKNSADTEFSFLKKLQETNQKNTKNLRDNVTELLLWTPSSRRPPARQYKTVRPPTSRAMRPPSFAGLRAPPPPAPASVRAHMRPPSRAGRRPPARHYMTVRPPMRRGRVEGVN